ncbi:hypothetical protein COCCADRAFT_41087 [Bipolaris zeicola 26-R-13]|uniref:Rhodopsin domain-containing protein n=1 Tax=Cochliobolus carbonum (strain 26-R-13) TaxID=930089 RepID=W6XRW8_COCC2|nr:uncharacterized protein COCCADRAFT_41087 [Bipolaris zeicola 26-R-13]EUC28383.1 hypothetical protein COCCADRAFT_41087 [Bipolaris zeicola 26-R-13]
MDMGTSIQPLAYGIAYSTFFVGTLSILLRFYCRYIVLRTWGWDDYIAVAILAFSFAQQGVLQMFLYWGCGLHMEALDTNHHLEILKWLFVEEVLYYSVHWVIKLAFLVFYLRLSPDSDTFRHAVYFGVGLNTVVWIASVLVACFQCMPFDEIFHPGMHSDAQCINKMILLLGPCILNILVDIYILILPISTIWALKNIRMRRKIAVLCVIGFGGISVLIACSRIVILLRLSSPSPSLDTSYILGTMIVVSALEIQSAIIAVNLPSLKALWTKYTGATPPALVPTSRQNLHNKAYKMSSFSGTGSSTPSSLDRPRNTKKRNSDTASFWDADNPLTTLASEEESVLGDMMAVVMPIQWVRSDIRAIRVGRGYIVRSMMSMERVEDCFPVGHFLRNYGPRRDAESVVASLV